jgi:hypothetical protein
MNRQPNDLGRLILLAPDGRLAAVLAELPPAELARRARAEAAERPGRIVCGEWLDRDGRWQRAIEAVA